MAVYVYDNTQIDLFVTEDRGLITASVTETFNGGNITGVPDNDNDVNNFDPHYYGEIRYSGDVSPFGNIGEINGGAARTAYVPALSVTVLFSIEDKAEVSYRTIWHGSGSLFEIGGGLERVVQPDLGAAGPSPRIYGEIEVPRRTYSEVGSGTLSLSNNAATFKYNAYPYSASGTLSISGFNSQTYPDDYIPVTRNLIKLKIGKEGSKEAYVWHYRLQGNEVFDLEDYGFITALEGSDFSNTALSFDKTITKAKDRSFSDSDQLEFDDYGVITETTSESQDDGVLERKLGGGLFAHAYQATGTAAVDKFIHQYVSEVGAGSILFQLTTTDPEIRTFAHEASGGFTVSGQNWFSQAPQSRVFGLEGELSISGGSEERFIPATADGTGLFEISGNAKERIISQAGEKKPLLRPIGLVVLLLQNKFHPRQQKLFFLVNFHQLMFYLLQILHNYSRFLEMQLDLRNQYSLRTSDLPLNLQMKPQRIGDLYLLHTQITRIGVT
jgi:hypothetical protein